jgi:hypothetical protein
VDSDQPVNIMCDDDRSKSHHREHRAVKGCAVVEMRMLALRCRENDPAHLDRARCPKSECDALH